MLRKEGLQSIDVIYCMKFARSLTPFLYTFNHIFVKIVHFLHYLLANDSIMKY